VWDTAVVGIRLVGIDIDGTLLDGAGRLPPENAAAIAACQAAGIEVALVTGRAFHFAAPVAALLTPPLTLAVNNGAVIKRQDGTTLHATPLPAATARAILEATTGYADSVGVSFDRPTGGFAAYATMDWTHPNRRGYYERNRQYIRIVASFDPLLEEDPVAVIFNGPVARMRALAGELASLPFARAFSTTLTEYPHRDFSLLDIMAPGCSKGSALGEWAARRGLTREEVMAIGDNLNDLEMLRYAGVPVVMGNAVPELKEMGWPETASHDEAGLASALRRYALDEQG
jgi:Cof subfamily protein (haloacid dehalogenase superfamily)